MHLNGAQIVKMSSEGKNMKEIGKWTEVLCFLKKVWSPGFGLPYPGAMYMYITKIFKDVPLSQ